MAFLYFVLFSSTKQSRRKRRNKNAARRLQFLQAELNACIRKNGKLFEQRERKMQNIRKYKRFCLIWFPFAEQSRERAKSISSILRDLFLSLRLLREIYVQIIASASVPQSNTIDRYTLEWLCKNSLCWLADWLGLYICFSLAFCLFQTNVFFFFLLLLSNDPIFYARKSCRRPIIYTASAEKKKWAIFFCCLDRKRNWSWMETKIVQQNEITVNLIRMRDMRSFSIKAGKILRFISYW